VSLRQSFRDVLQVSQQLPQFRSLTMNLFAQRHAIDEFHGNEVHAIGLANFVDRGDVWD
jgi:hypothetical protein